MDKPLSEKDSRPHSRFASPRAAYVHVPFCRHRCGYCNFTLIAGRDDLIGSYLQALECELSWLGSAREVDTLFIGGGTPTHLGGEQLQQLCETVLRWLPLADKHEFSVEANPLDVTLEKAELLAANGVNRMSLGAQSFNATKLAVLERDHQAEHVASAFEAARATMQSVSVDLIFGAPDESTADWEEDIRLALELAPDHISTYGLTFEQGTSFWSRLRKEELSPVAEEDEREMYLTAIDRLTIADFEHYEVSNFAQHGHRCRHNEVYWAGQPYFAAGPGAARYVNGRRQTNHRSTTTYLNRVLAGSSPVAESEKLDDEESARERLVFGLRRLEGIQRQAFHESTGFDVNELVGESLSRFVEANLLEDKDGAIRLTRKGLLVSDSIWPEFLSR